MLGADNTHGHTVVQAEWGTYGHYPLSHLQHFSIPDADHRQILGIDLDHGNVGPTVLADYLAPEFALVGQSHHQRIGVVNDMGVGQNVAISRNDES